MGDGNDGPLWGNQLELPGFSPAPGVRMQPLSGERMMLNFVAIDPGATVATHHHPHEQAGTVLRGVLILTVGDETRELAPGDAYIIPGGIAHSATTDDLGCLVLDVFSPPREDYLNRAE